ncbi:MAG: hypothetical protein ACT4P0_05755 [Panacagrimonas sp.]
MDWKIDWRPAGYGLAIHYATGAAFNISRTGWLAVNDAAGLSDWQLSAVMSELRTLLDDIVAAGGSERTSLH